MNGRRVKAGKSRRVWLTALLLAVLCVLPGQSGGPSAAASPAAEAEPEEPTVFPEPVEEAAPVERIPWAPVAASDPVEDSYFDDAAFVGDSRTDGFRLYSGLDRGEYFCVTGETVASATELENWTLPDGGKVSLADAVAEADCGKIYLMLGVNELGWSGTDIFRGHAETLIQRLKADHPEAALVIQSLPPVTAEQDAKKTYVNNQRILAYNQVWRELAEKYDCAYVDVAEAVAGEDGCLPKELSYDGVHLNKAGCKLWLEYLRTHSVAVPDSLTDTDVPDSAAA